MSGHVRRALECVAASHRGRVRRACQAFNQYILMRNEPHENGPLVIPGLKAQIADFERQQLSERSSIPLAEHDEQQRLRMQACYTEILGEFKLLAHHSDGPNDVPQRGRSDISTY